MGIESYRKLLYWHLLVNSLSLLLMLICVFAWTAEAVNLAGGFFILGIGSNILIVVTFNNSQDINKKCAFCGTKSSTKFCPKCGKPMNSEIPQSENKVCSKCGQALKGETFCPGCGTKTN
jgi:hypothetical protein